MSFQFPKKEPFIFTWHIAAKPIPPATVGVPVTDCDPVVATLYAGRSTNNPDLIPGLPVSSLSSVALANLGGGDYAAEIGSDGDFNPLPSTNYRIVIVATRDDEPFGYWEESVEVVVNS